MYDRGPSNIKLGMFVCSYDVCRTISYEITQNDGLRCVLTFAGHSLVQVWSQLRLYTFAGVQGIVLDSKGSNKLLQIRKINAIF